MTMELWDKHGHAVAYVDGDQESIYLQDGTPAGWLSGNGIYTYGGKFLGWLYEGWIFGRDGKCVLFTERAQPGAVKPEFARDARQRLDDFERARQRCLTGFLAVVGAAAEERLQRRLLQRKLFQVDLRVHRQSRGFAHETDRNRKSTEFIH